MYVHVICGCKWGDIYIKDSLGFRVASFIIRKQQNEAFDYVHVEFSNNTHTRGYIVMNYQSNAYQVLHVILRDIILKVVPRPCSLLVCSELGGKHFFKLYTYLDASKQVSQLNLADTVDLDMQRGFT